MSAILAIDIGGSKILAALVDGPQVIARAEMPTDRQGGPIRWLQQIAEMVAAWAGRFKAAGMAVTGRVAGGQWWAMNPNTLPIPDAFALNTEAERALGVSIVLANDAQAAAWGEHVYGAGQNRDLAFLTVSTGIGGGFVLGGKLITGRDGLAGAVGQMPCTDDGAWYESRAAGRWMAAEAQRLGHATDARGVFEAAAQGAPWAETILEAAASRIAQLCRTLQQTVDPQVMVLGGGIGLAPGFLARVERALSTLPAVQRPNLVAAQLGADAGVIGIAHLANHPDCLQQES